ncbi:MAG: GAF domain-containing protein [Chloroflexia bacterium]|nr:GAF domain-containing protein [Chloroflexia bacterium]
MNNIVHVLLIEDSAGDTRLVQEMLAEASSTGWGRPAFELETVETLGGALQRLAQGGIDVILSDLDLPDSRAEQTFTTLQRHSGQIPLVVLTGRTDEALAIQSMREGAEDYLFKGETNSSLLCRTLLYAIQRQQIKTMLRQQAAQLEQQVAQRTAELDQANNMLQKELAARRQAETALQEKNRHLQERIKELDCLYGISALAEQVGHSLEDILRGTVALIPPAWQYPQVARARIWLEGRPFASDDDFAPSTWCQSAPIVVQGQVLGQVEVYYLEERPAADEGPFLKEERRLLNAIAERLGQIVERLRIEQALRNSETRYRSLIETSPDAIALADMQGVLFYVNPVFLAMWGYAQEGAVLGRSILDFWHSKGQARAVLDDLQSQQGRTGETVIRRRDGSPLDVQFSASLVHGEGGEPLCLRASFMDISAYKRVQQDLAREAALDAALAALYAPLISPSSSIKEITQTILEQAKALTNSPHGYVSTIDPQSGDMHSHTLTEMLHGACQISEEKRHVIFPLGPDGRYGGLWGHSLNTRRPFFSNEPTSHPTSTGTPSGHIPLRRFLAVPVHLGDVLVGQIALANADRDYNAWDLAAIQKMGTFYALALQRKGYEEAQIRYAQELARSNAELEQFAYVVSHDLQEPLRMVSSFAQLLERRYRGQLDDQADEFIHYISDGANRMQQMIRALLTYSRVNTRGQDLVSSDAGLILERALRDLGLAIEESGAQITHDPLPTVLADPIQLSQLLQNLLNNALKFRGQDPPQVHISARREGDDWLFSVRDNGIGIPLEHSERIFEIFQRLHTREEYPGTGIGLALCKRIVERHGGRIWVESTPGQGSIFYFTLKDAPTQGTAAP